ncbi:MAG TPA: AI-2E family transporter [Intrasporangium sp.]|nr:AI-2E family transporter [Intrasporangium sp.]
MTHPTTEPPSPVAHQSSPVARGAVVLVASASAVIVIAGIRGAAGLIGPAFLALVLTVTVHPAMAYVRRRGWPPWVGVAGGLVAVYLLVIGLTLAVVGSLARFATLLQDYKDDAEELVDDISSRLEGLGVGSEQQQTVASAFDLGKLTDVILEILGSLASLSSNLFFLVALLLFMVVDASSFPARLAAVRDHHGLVVDALSSFSRGTRRYLVVSTIFGLVVAIIDTVALALLDVPAPLLWGLLAFITNYIPNIGFVIGLVPPAVLGLLEGGPDTMLLVIVIYCVVNFVIQSLIQPKFVGDAVGLSGTVTMLSLVFWAWVLGAVGALMAIPLTLLAKALLVEADPRARWLLPLLSGTAHDRSRDES